MKKLIASTIVALGLCLSAFLTSSAMAGSYAIGIIGATGEVDTTGSELEGNQSADSDQETTTPRESETLVYGAIFAEYSFGEKYGMTLGVSYSPMTTELGTKSRTDSQSLSSSFKTLTSVGKIASVSSL